MIKWDRVTFPDANAQSGLGFRAISRAKRNAQTGLGSCK